jgi:hypothetical protein
MESPEINENPDSPEAKRLKFPQKKYYRQRAHCNPIADHNIE